MKTRLKHGKPTRLILLVLLGLSVLPRFTLAENLDAAREEFNKGRQAYYEGRYEDAIKHYQMAIDFQYSAKLFYNIGLALEKLGQYSKAKEAFSRYLTEQPAAKNKKEVQEKLEQLTALEKQPPEPLESQPDVPTAPGTGTDQPAPAPGPRIFTPPPVPASIQPEAGTPKQLGPEITVDFSTEPQGAELFLNGRMMGLTPLRLNIPQGGLYDLRLEKYGFHPTQQRIQVTERKQYTIKLAYAEEGRHRWMTRTEWFAIEGMFGAASERDTVSGGVFLQFFTLKWHRFFWTIWEWGGVGGAMPSFIMGTRPGFPIYLGERGQHQLRGSLGLNFSSMKTKKISLTPQKETTTVNLSGPALSPTLEYRYQTKGSFFFGAALRGFVLVSSDEDLHPFLALFCLHVGWASRP